MYGHLNCGEFVFGYWGLMVNALIRALSLNGIQQIKMKSIRKLSNFNFQWTKICTRIFQAILHPFLHFSRAVDVIISYL